MTAVNILKYLSVGAVTCVTAIGTHRLIQFNRTRTAKVAMKPETSTQARYEGIPQHILAEAKRQVAERNWDGCTRVPSAVELITRCDKDTYDFLIGIEDSVIIDCIPVADRTREATARTAEVIEQIIDTHAQRDLRAQQAIIKSRIGSERLSKAQTNRPIANIVTV